MLNIIFKYNIELQQVKLYYKTFLALKSDPKTNDWENQSLMVLELPNWVDYRLIRIDEQFSLSCDNNWTVFPKMDIDLELDADKTILFIYNIVLPLVEKKMTVGIFLNNRLDKKSILTYSSVMYFKALGYYPIKLNAGKWKIQLRYITDGCVIYNPASDWQDVSMTVLDMN